MNSDLIKRLHAALGGVEVPRVMNGDNLSITLCTAYENPDQETDDESGWTPDAIRGQEETLSAIRTHYDPTLRGMADALTAAQEENERLREVLREVADIPSGGFHSVSGDWFISRKLVAKARAAINGLPR